MHEVADLCGISQSSVFRITQEGDMNNVFSMAGIKKRASNKASVEAEAFNYQEPCNVRN